MRASAFIWIAGLAALTGCAASAPLPPWLALSDEERRARLFDGLATDPRTLRVEGAELRFVEISPSPKKTHGRAILFVHGIGGELSNYTPLLLQMSGGTERVLALDLPGFGASVSIDSDYSIASYVRVLRQFADAMGVTELDLVCHSLGGQICLGLTLDAPGLIHSLVLIDSAGIYDQSQFIAYQSHGAIRSVRPERDVAIRTLIGGDLEVVQRLLGDSPFIVAAINSFRQNYRRRVRDIRVPTLIIWGGDDHVFPVENAFFLKENIAGSTLRVIPEAPHTPQLSHPEIVLAFIEEFHNRLAQERP